MVLQLFGHSLSGATRRVAFVLHEKRVPFELVVIDYSKGEHKAPAVLEKQPFGQVPYIIDDDGLVLYESRAIAWYIATKYEGQGTSLIPSDLKSRALMMQAWSVETAHFIHAERALTEVLYKKYMKLEPNPVALKEYLDALEKSLDVFDKILSNQNYMAGNEITIVDTFYFPFAEMLDQIGQGGLIEARPAVKKWYDAVRTRPAWHVLKEGAQTTLSWD